MLTTDGHFSFSNVDLNPAALPHDHLLS